MLNINVKYNAYNNSFIYFFYNANNNKKLNECTSTMKNGLNL